MYVGHFKKEYDEQKSQIVFWIYNFIHSKQLYINSFLEMIFRAFILSLVLILVETTAVCKQRFALTYNCSLLFQIDQEQNSSSFLYCKNTQTAQQSQWSICLTYCCPNIPPSSFSISVLQQCVSGTQKTSNSVNPLVISIVFITIGSGLIILGLICKSCRSYMINQDLKKLMEDLPEHERNKLTTSCKDEKWIQKPGIMDKFTFSISDMIEDINCSICLQGKTNIITLPCYHKFHEDCLCEWFSKKQICPMCRAEVNFVKLKCKEKCGKYMIIKLMDFLVIREDISKQCKSCEAGGMKGEDMII